jgi:aminopeptidase N
LYADPAWAPTGRAALAATAHEAALAAEPGSDFQLAWVRALASLASTDDQLALLSGLLDGTASVPGLAVDTELRWALLHRLVVLGGADVEAIDAELERDATAAGQRHAASCRAARPTAEAKAEAWAAAVESDELPNAMQAAVISGIVNAEQTDLLEPYVEPYFAAVGEVWATRTAEMAQNIVVGLYPTLLVSPAVVQRTDDYLSSADVPPALARLLLEGRDGVVRALRARARDAAS